MRVSYLPEANDNAALELMIALSREGDMLQGKLYVLAPEAGADSSLVEHVVGDWEAAALATPWSLAARSALAGLRRDR
jgi:hypothetical protein